MANTKSFQDDLYDVIVDYVISTQKVSTSLLQRKFGIGYNRAANLIDVLENEGIIGPPNGSKSREVLIRYKTNNKTFKKGDIVKHTIDSNTYMDKQPILFLEDSGNITDSKFINLAFGISGNVGKFSVNPDVVDYCDDEFKESIHYQILNEISKMITNKQSEEVTYQNISSIQINDIRRSLDEMLK